MSTPRVYSIEKTAVAGAPYNVTCVVLAPDDVDLQNDVIASDVIRKAAYAFVEGYNLDPALGGTALWHGHKGPGAITLAESFLARDVMKIGEQDVQPGTWIMTMRVYDENMKAKIDAGEFTGFSIGGSAFKEDT